jgi:hypothetical protein
MTGYRNAAPGKGMFTARAVSVTVQCAKDVPRLRHPTDDKLAGGDVVSFVGNELGGREHRSARPGKLADVPQSPGQPRNHDEVPR